MTPSAFLAITCYLFTKSPLFSFHSKTTPTSHQQLYISCTLSCLSTRCQFWDCTHFPPIHTQLSVCAEHIIYKSVTAWQVIAPNGCQHAEMWGGHCEERSETRGENPSLSLTKSLTSHQSLPRTWINTGEHTLPRLKQEKPAQCFKPMPKIIRDKERPHLCPVIPRRE